MVIITGGENTEILLAVKKVKLFVLSGGRDTKTFGHEHLRTLSILPNKPPGGISTT